MNRIPEKENEYETENSALIYESIANDLWWLDDSFVVKLLNMGVNSGKILDIGTGPGTIPLNITKRGLDFTVHATDISYSMLKLASHNLKNANHCEQKIVLIQAGGLSLPYHDDSFDIVYSNSTLHHIGDIVAFLNEAYRVMKKDGALFIRDLQRPDSPEEFESILHEITPSYISEKKSMVKDSLTAAYSAKEVCSALEKSNIPSAEIKLYSRTHLSIEIISPRNKNTNIAPQTEHIPFLNELKQEYLTGKSFKLVDNHTLF